MITPLIAITRKHAIVFALYLVLYEFLVYIANDMIMPGMLSVVRDFNAGDSKVATSLTAYILGGSSLQLILGPLSDRVGRRPVMLAGCLFFAVFTLLLPWTQTIDQFLIGRFFEGMGLCYIHVVGYALLQEIFSDSDAIRLIAIMANVAILAPLLGPLAGSIFLQYASWRDSFYLIGGLSLFALWGLWHYMPESVGQKKNDGKIIKRSVSSFTTVLKNYKTLVKHPVFLLGLLSYGVIGIPCVLWIALSPVILVSNAHMSLFMYGVWQIPVFGAFILGNLLLSVCSTKYSPRTLSFMGGIGVLSGTLLMWWLPNAFNADPVYLMPGLVLYSLGYSVAATSLFRFILFITQIGTGTTSALISMVMMCFMGAGIELGNYLFSLQGNLSFAEYIGCLGVFYFVCHSLTLYFHNRVQALEKENV